MSVSFEISERQADLRARARAFANEKLLPLSAQLAQELAPRTRFEKTRQTYADLISAGFLRYMIPAPLGGDGHSLLDGAIMAEELYWAEPGTVLTMLGTGLGMLPVMIGGNPDQHARLLAPFLETSGTPLAAFASSEPGGSANAAAPAPGEGVRTKAKRAGDDWVINGAKRWVSSSTGWDGKGADLMCVVCNTQSAENPNGGISVIAVEGPAEGVVETGLVDAIGHKNHLLPDMDLIDVRAPDSNMLGGEGCGLNIAEGAFLGTAPLVGIFGVSLMRAAFEYTLNFARTERRGGVHFIIDHQAVGYALSDAKAAIEAVRWLCWRACIAADTQEAGAAELALHAKVYGSETAVRVITDLMRLVGVESYTQACPLGRLLQDALALPVFDGGNMGIRRRQLHDVLRTPDYSATQTLG